MLRRLPSCLLPPGLLLLAACPEFEVGPEAYALLGSPQACEAARLGPGTCTRFELENGSIPSNAPMHPVLLSFGFEAPERNLDTLMLSYERPGRSPERITCPFGYGLVGAEVPGVFGCVSVGLAGANSEVNGTLEGAAEGIIAIDAWIATEAPGSYAMSAWLLDDNGFESPVVRWQFPADPPDRRPDDCCAAHGSSGCPDEVCTEAICQEDPFCCSDRWDRLCADAALEHKMCRGVGGSCPG